jgi:hypothetical protein
MNNHIIFCKTENLLKRGMDDKNYDEKIIKSAIDEISEHKRASTVENKLQKLVQEIPKDYIQRGIISCDITKAIKNFTVSGKLYPEMRDIPKIKVKLLEHPDINIPFGLTAKTGTRYDFNIHMMATYKDDLLPIGKYSFQYEAESRTDEDYLINNEQFFL